MTDTDIQIRRLTLKDVLPSVRISNQAFYEHARFPEMGARTVSRIEQDPDWQWAALVDNELMGFLLCEPRADKTRVAIRLIATAPSVQGKGVGSRLLAELEEEAKKEGYTALSVGTPFARRFYKRNGFKDSQLTLRLIKDITRQAVDKGEGVQLRTLDLDAASAMLPEIPEAQRGKFLTAFLNSYRRYPGLAVRVDREGECLGVVIGKGLDFYHDFVEVTFSGLLSGRREGLIRAFEHTVSTLGLRYIGYSVAEHEEALFEAIGYKRSERDFFWTMYTLVKELDSGE